MKITDLLLKDSNTTLCGNCTIGERVAASGKKKLWSERNTQNIDVIVIHYMSAIELYPSDPYSIEHAIGIFCDYGVSSHYIIDRSGEVFRCVPDNKKAWHAGCSIMPAPDNRQGVNEFSIGIELLATHDSGFTDLQYRSLTELCTELEESNGKKMSYVGHENIAGEQAVAMGLRKDIKKDPGPLFDWDLFFSGLELLRNKNVSPLPV